MRIRLVRPLMRSGAIGQSLALAVLRPRDLLELNRLHYSQPDVLSLLSDETYVDSGLTSGEEALLDRVPLRQGRLLDLGAGAGREAIALARRGFEVTCIDFMVELNEKAKANGIRHGFSIRTLTREFAAAIDVPVGSFDIAWLTSQMYSSIPGRTGRVRMLRGIACALRPEGIFACQFRWHPSFATTSVGSAVRRVAAFVGVGNRSFESGDQLLGSSEFAHCFSSEPELRSEFAQGGFDVLDIRFEEGMWCGWTVLSKCEHHGSGRRQE